MRKKKKNDDDDELLLKAYRNFGYRNSFKSFGSSLPESVQVYLTFRASLLRVTWPNSRLNHENNSLARHAYY